MDEWPPRFTVEPHGAAALFLRLHYSTPPGVYELDLLTKVIEMFQSEARHKALEETKSLYRSIHPGGCHILSATMSGTECKCFHCRVDDELHQLKQEAEHEP